jgi:hypothetical protein
MSSLREILNSHPVSVLRQEIAKQNIKGYHAAKKSEVLDKMLEHPKRFQHITMADKKPRSEAQIAAGKKLGAASKARAAAKAAANAAPAEAAKRKKRPKIALPGFKGNFKVKPCKN